MDINPYLPPQAEIIVSHASDDAESIRREHIKHEASVKSVGTLYYLAFGVMVISALTIVGGMQNFDNAVALGTVVGALAIASLMFFMGGGLRRLRSWARVPAIILSCIGLLGFPLGTLIHAYILYLLLSAKGVVVFSDRYQQVIAQTPHIKYKSPILVVILLVVLVLILIGVLVAVFSK